MTSSKTKSSKGSLGSDSGYKSLARSYFKSYETALPEKVVAFLHKNHVYHPPGGSPPQDISERMRDEKLFFAGFSDIEVQIEDLFAEGNKVASRVTMCATHSGPFHDIKSSGRRVSISFIDIALIHDDKMLEEWTEFDLQSILRQLT